MSAQNWNITTVPEKISSQINASLDTIEPEKALVKKAFLDRINQCGWPTPKNENYTYLNPKRALEPTWEAVSHTGKAKTPEIKECPVSSCCINIIDGLLDSANSCLQNEADIKVSQQKVYTPNDVEYDIPGLLNGAFASEEVVIDIQPDTNVEKFLFIHFLVSKHSKETGIFPRVRINLGENSHLRIGLIGDLSEEEQALFVSSSLQVNLDRGAQLELSEFFQGNSQSRIFHQNFITQKGGSKAEVVLSSAGSSIARTHNLIQLQEPQAHFGIEAISVLKDENSQHHHLDLQHLVEDCTSNQRFSQVLSGQSAASVDGTVLVEKNAQRTDSNQLIRTLMLSDDASAAGKPNLKIYADDVKCAHGSTIGDLEEEELFYLQSRGLSTDLARKALTFGFIEESLQQIPFVDFTKFIEEKLLAQLEEN